MIPWTDLSENIPTIGAPIDWKWSSTPTNLIEVEILDPQLQFVIIVEKEAVFHRLEQNFLQVPCVLITSCGYPDVASRAVVGKLSNLFPTLTVLGICDYNPHGLALILCFRLQSPTTAFEAAGFQSNIRWLGLRSNHIKNLFGINTDFNHNAQKLTENDKKKIVTLLSCSFVKQQPLYINEIEEMQKGKLVK